MRKLVTILGELLKLVPRSRYHEASDESATNQMNMG